MAGKYGRESKKERRIARGLRTKRIQQTSKNRLLVHRTARHIYAQVLSDTGRVVLAASTVQKDIREKLANQRGSDVAASRYLGEVLAKKLLHQGIKQVAFDRRGFKFHGRVGALAEAVREHGLKI